MAQSPRMAYRWGEKPVLVRCQSMETSRGVFGSPTNSLRRNLTVGFTKPFLPAVWNGCQQHSGYREVEAGETSVQPAHQCSPGRNSTLHHVEEGPFPPQATQHPQLNAKRSHILLDWKSSLPSSFQNTYLWVTLSIPLP